MVLGARHGQAVLVAERVCVCEIDEEDGQRLLRNHPQGTGPVVTWRQAQVVPLPAQGLPLTR
jgi:hypothetical protein